MRFHFSLNTEKLERWAYIVTIIGFPVLVLSLVLVFYQISLINYQTGLGLYQISELHRVASSQNNIALNAMFYDETNVGILNAIENDTPILKEHKGNYTAVQLDHYLGDFNIIYEAYLENLLTEDQMCVLVANEVTMTMANSEVKAYLASTGYNNSGLSFLAKIIANSKNTDCGK